MAVSTAFKDALHQFGFSLFSFQMFISRRYRRLWLAQSIIVRAWRELNARYQAGQDRDAFGLLIEIPNPKIMRIKNETIWRDQGAEFVYVGKISGAITGGCGILKILVSLLNKYGGQGDTTYLPYVRKSFWSYSSMAVKRPR